MRNFVIMLVCSVMLFANAAGSVGSLGDEANCCQEYIGIQPTYILPPVKDPVK